MPILQYKIMAQQQVGQCFHNSVDQTHFTVGLVFCMTRPGSYFMHSIWDHCEGDHLVPILKPMIGNGQLVILFSQLLLHNLKCFWFPSWLNCESFTSRWRHSLRHGEPYPCP